jgi:hypothetical protein
VRAGTSESRSTFVTGLFASEPDPVVAARIGDHISAVIDGEDELAILAQPGGPEVGDLANDKVPIREDHVVARR